MNTRETLGNSETWVKCPVGWLGRLGSDATAASAEFLLGLAVCGSLGACGSANENEALDSSQGDGVQTKDAREDMFISDVRSKTPDVFVEPVPDLCWHGTCPEATWCTSGGAPLCERIACTWPSDPIPSEAWEVVEIDVSKRYDDCDFTGDGLPDNRLGSLSGEINLDAREAIHDGSLVRLLHPVPGLALGGHFKLAWEEGGTPPSGEVCANAEVPNPACEGALRKETFGLEVPGVCQAASVCEATWVGSLLKINCPGVFPLPEVKEPELNIPARDVTMQGKFLPSFAMATLHMCGRFQLSDIDALIDKVPPANLAKLKFGDNAKVKEMLHKLMAPDVDADGDGVKESVSFGATLTIRKVTVAGVLK